MKVIHVVLDHKTFRGRVAAYFKRLFPEHNFIMYDKEPGGIDGFQAEPQPEIDYVNIPDTKGQIAFFKDIEKKYDLIVLHSLFLFPLSRVYFGLFDHKFIKKCVWIEWGYDIYENTSPSLKLRFYRRVNPLLIYIFARKIPYFIAISEMDLDQYKHYIKGNAKCFFAPYTSITTENWRKTIEFYQSYTKVTMEEKRQRGEPVLIQLGHRAEPFLHHKKWIDRLAEYKDDNFQVLLPLSYGKEQYGKDVAAYAKEKLGEKALTLIDVLPFKEYFRLLDRVDIFILDATRQIGLGNIHNLFLKRKKIYLPRDGQMSSFFMSKGISVCDIEEIGKVPFDSLTADIDMSAALKYIIQLRSLDTDSMWENIFFEIKKDMFGE